MNFRTSAATSGLVRFPRGFFWSSDGRRPPAHYLDTDFPGLFVAPNGLVQGAYGVDSQVTVIGMCVPTYRWSATNETVSSKILAAAAEGDNELFRYLDLLCGKYVIFLRQGARTRIFHDAAATRTVFYRRDFTAVASHVALVTDGHRSTLPFRGAYHGNATPFPDTKLLLANSALDLTVKHAFRYWPREAIQESTIEEAADRLATLGVTALRNLPAGSDIRLAATAGIDSRTSLALLKLSGVKYSTYTYDTSAEADVFVPLLLARLFNHAHTYVGTPPLTPDVREAVAEAAYFRSTAYSIGGLTEHFSRPNPVSIISNVYEIGQGYYQKDKNSIVPDSAAAMQKLFASRLYGVRDKIEVYSTEAYERESLAHFEEMYEETDFARAITMIDPFDLYYWEHRMGGWHSTQMLERDFFAEGFIPLNSRAALTAALSIPLPDRISCAAFRGVIAKADERLLDIPINPNSLTEILTCSQRTTSSNG